MAKKSKLIGKIYLKGKAVAGLTEDFVWESSDEGLLEHLNALYDPAKASRSPVGIPGRSLVLEAAKELGGEAKFPKVEEVELPEGVVI